MNRRFALSPGAVLVLSLIYFFEGISGLGAVLLSVAVHEIGHTAAIKLSGGRVKHLRFDSSGLCISGVGTYSTAGEVFILLSGPLAGLVLAYACSKLGAERANGFLLRTAGISFMLTVYNMLPAMPLDGGRVLGILLGSLIGEKKAGCVMQYMSFLAAAFLAAAGISAHDTQLGLVFLSASFWLLIAQKPIVKRKRLM